MAVGVKQERLQEDAQMAAAAVSPSFVPWDRFLANSKVPQGQTDEIITWVTKINQKRSALRSGSRQRDLRKEALLENARRAATAALQTLQCERMARWRNLRATLEQPTLAPSPPPPPQQQRSLCDCDSCFLCRRHRGGLFDKCYCSVIFSPRPVFMDFTSSTSSIGCAGAAGRLAVDLYAGVAESQEIDNFLASLGPSRHSSKRKSDEDCWLLRKRCKA